jgi:YidC/Oxa1 family membrane protein insertase
MEKRLILAVLLMAAVMMVTSVLFPPQELPPEEEVAAAERPAPERQPAGEEAPPLVLPSAEDELPAADTIWVTSPLYRYGVISRGGAVVRAEALRHASYIDPDAPVQMVPGDSPGFLRHRLVLAGDTVELAALAFHASPAALDLAAGDEPGEIRFLYGAEEGFSIELLYRFTPDDFVIGIEGRIRGAPAGSQLLLGIADGMEIHEAPAHRSERHLAAVARNGDGIRNLQLRRVRGEQRLEGRFSWAGVKDKYFLAAAIPGDELPFAGVRISEIGLAAQVREGMDTLLVPRAQVTGELPLRQDGTFTYLAYLGPQEYQRLAALGYELQQVNPYGYRWLRWLIRPIAAAILWLLDLLHISLGIGYGWVLIIFGVLMRIVLWPLNAKAMRAQMKNMAVQPQLQARMAEVKEKYRSDPKKQQQEMMAVYQELGVNPFSMLSGCLPLLIPMPVLITLFFVFQDSIAFRGEEFGWLPDLSLPDPYYLLPIFLVISMFLLQWMSAKISGMEHNPQMKMMMYMMPLFIGFIFFMLPAGLNLYYATTNVATVPQQVLIALERKRAQEALKAAEPAKKKAPGGRPKRPAGKGKRGRGG